MIQLRMVIAWLLLSFSASAANSSTKELSKEFGICLEDAGNFTIANHVVIDVEKVVINIGDRKLATVVFDELGLGAYNQMIESTSLSGAEFKTDSGVSVYAQLFSGTTLTFVARSMRPKPVWIYTTFDGVNGREDAGNAVRVMKRITSCPFPSAGDPKGQHALLN